jgi:hypothetical protein
MPPEYPNRYLPEYSKLGRIPRTLHRAAVPFMRYTGGRGDIIPQRGIADFRGYQIPGALLAQMAATAGAARGRFDPIRTYFGGAPTAPTTSEEVRKAYLRSIAPIYAGTGAMSPYQEAQQQAERLRGEQQREGLREAQAMGATYDPTRQFRRETLVATGAPTQATQQAREARKLRQQQLKAQQQKVQAGQTGRRAHQKQQDIRLMMGEHLKRLRKIQPTRSNVQIREKVAGFS